MSFHHSAQDISLDGTTLKATLFNADGEGQEAELDLDEVLSNNEGEAHSPGPLPSLTPGLQDGNIQLKPSPSWIGAFEWGGGGFAESASDIEFSIEGDDGIPVLRATLRNSEDEEVAADVNLAERIGNNNGEFHFGGLPVPAVGFCADGVVE